MNKEELYEYVKKDQDNIRQIVAIKDGIMVYNEKWQGYKADDALHVMSATKSIVSILLGIAIDQGMISGIDQKVLEFYPDYVVKRGEKTIQNVTIRNMITMTAPYKYRYEPWTKVCTSEDWALTSLDFLGGRKGITGEFRYTTVCQHILTGIISRASGLNTVDFANKYLFEPLGIEKYSGYMAMDVEEHKSFIMSKEPKGRIWFVDEKGIGAAGYGLCISAEDMAKIGLMCLNKGKYNGQQIVSAKWIKESTKPRIQCDYTFAEMRYGYMWWLPDKDSEAYGALGNSGNVIYINPHNNEVVAITATFKPRVLDRVPFIHKYIEPMLKEKGVVV